MIKTDNLYRNLFYLVYDTTSSNFVDQNVATVLRKHNKGYVTLECKTNSILHHCVWTHTIDVIDALQDCYLYQNVIFISCQDDWFLKVKCTSAKKKNRQKTGLMLSGNANSFIYSF